MPLTGTCHYLVPPDAPRKTLRAALMAMKVPPKEVAPELAGLKRMRDALVQDERAVAVVDLSTLPPTVQHVLALAAFLREAAVCSQVILLRCTDGPVWEAERQWLKGLGFADVLTDLDPVGLAIEPLHLMDAIAAATGAADMAAADLTRYFSAMQVRADPALPRSLIRALTGLSAEALASSLASGVKALDRVHNLTTYPACFVGTEAVTWLAGQYQISRNKAVRLGRALQSLRLLDHVVHEHPFDDTAYFYRAAVSTAADRLHPGAVLQAMRAAGGLEVKDRSYHLRNYPACFVGTQAVEWLHSRYRIARHEAEIFLNRLNGYGLIRHVTDAHRVRDGDFFYRFVD